MRVPRSALAAFFGAAACYGVLVMTDPPGPGLDPDAMSYLGAAESLTRHGSLRIPMARWSDADSTSALGHFPPGFPLAIAAPVALGAPPEQAARAVVALGGFATVGLAVWLVAAVSNPVAAVVAGIVLLESPSLLLDHVAVLSEPLCLALLLATLGLIVFSESPLAYGTAAAAAGMVRYAALSAPVAAVLWALGFRGRLGGRLRRAALAAAPAVVLQAAWAGRMYSESGYVRGLGLHGDLARSLEELRATLSGWLAPAVPGRLAQSLLAVVVAAAVVALLASRRESVREPAAAPLPRFLRAAGLLAGCYVALLIAARVLADEEIPFDERLLSPAFLLAELAVVAALGVRWRAWRGAVRAAAAAVLALWLAGSAWTATLIARDVLRNGWDYGAPGWRGAPLGEWLRERGSGAQIFSNNPAPIYFLTGRPSRVLPLTVAPDSVRAFGRTLLSRPAVVVGFASPYDRMASPYSLARSLGLEKVATFEQATVWVPRPAPASVLPNGRLSAGRRPD